jgi:diguanylate cyclase (GGDEF)-like protein
VGVNSTAREWTDPPAGGRGVAHTVAAFLSARSRAFVLLVGLLLIAGLGLVDFLTGPELRLFIFYWPPIALVTWYAGRRWGISFVVLAGATWLAANWGGYAAGARFGLAAWNGAVNATSFVLLAIVVARLRQRVEREKEVARTDFATGVGNSRAFFEAVEREAATSRRTGAPLSLAYLDIDDFKRVNDRHGHEAGDLLLRSIAQTIRAQLRVSDTVARLGGDEFGIILAGADAAEARAVVERLRERLSQTYGLGGTAVSCSVGVVTCVATPCSSEELLRQADGLMYEVKLAGKSGARYAVLTG